ncbi:MAG: ANTAR domain-containing protein [Neomegalonema sp.]|nr:ANTAR domain-containing protein [Neomegalonema sp.]
MSTRIAVIDPDRDRALTIVDGLRAAGDYEIHVLGDETGVAKKLAAIDPDIVLIDLASPNRDTLESLARAASPLDRPVAMFVDQSDDAMIRSAIEAGVSAYVVDGLRPDRIKPVLAAAMARFHSVARLRAELDATKAALAERKIIDRAKGILMKSKGCDEDEAYAMMRKVAMDQNRKLAEIAQAIVTAAEIMG